MALTTVQNELMNAASSTGAFSIPVGTTAQRPASPTAGAMRYNTTIGDTEIYVNNAWVAMNYTPAPSVSVAPVISGSAVTNQNVTSTTGTWTQSPTGYFYQWLANNVAITSNATSNVFTITASELGANLTCNVIAYNTAGNSSPATSNSLGPVIAGYATDYLLAGGGGAGGVGYGNGGTGTYAAGGGGGAGGIIIGTTNLLPTTTYSVTVGVGGTANGISGGNTIAFSNTAVGGGYAGGPNPSVNATYTGANGGSGGGGSGGQLTSAGGNATTSQGYAGLTGSGYGGGGGGGYSSVGTDGNATSTGGYGGNGVTSSITGTAVAYGGGGGGGGYNSRTGGLGGTNTAGNGNSYGAYGGVGMHGIAFTGSGGGGGSTTTGPLVGFGAHGAAYFSYSGSQNMLVVSLHLLVEIQFINLPHLET